MGKTRNQQTHPATTNVDGAELLDLLPYGIATFDRKGVLTSINRAGRELLGEAVEGFEKRSVTCCELLACGSSDVLDGRCLTELAIERNTLLPEVRLDLLGGSGVSAVWVAAAPVELDEPTIVTHMRPGHPGDRRQRTVPHWTTDPGLKIVSFGRTEVHSAEVPLGGSWLAQRSGQLLKYLVVERHRVVYADEIAEALWPGREQGVLGTVRYFIHSLRGRLEPHRGKGDPSAFIISEGGGYRLNSDTVEVDADLFERNIRTARSALADGRVDDTKELLEESMDLYRADFIADEPYALWALTERERLRALAAEALETLTHISLSQGDRQGALAQLGRLAQMHPFDVDIERRLIGLALALGQQTFARRRYAAFRMRVLREFGVPPDFELADLMREDPTVAPDGGAGRLTSGA